MSVLQATISQLKQAYSYHCEQRAWAQEQLRRATRKETIAHYKEQIKQYSVKIDEISKKLYNFEERMLEEF
jgi:flagellar biosynthesis chaperone FliJ